IRDDLSGFFRRPPPAEEFGDVLARLRAAGLVAAKGQHLTDAGRARALAYLGVGELPAKANWRAVKARYLFPKALGVSPESAGDATQPPPPAAEDFDREAFANTVTAAARTCPTGRFGGNKVFISHVWRQLADEPRFAPLGLDGFKQKLVEANRGNLLTLSRADLVQVMDPADVRESETAYLNAVFHFVLVEKE